MKGSHNSVHHLISIKIPPAYNSLEATSTSLSQASDIDHIEDCFTCSNENSEGLSHLEILHDDNHISTRGFFSKTALLLPENGPELHICRSDPSEASSIVKC
jgi:hypothetical protein